MNKPITDHQRQQILALRNKRSGREIAAMVGVSTAIVSLVLNDKHKPSVGKPSPTAPAKVREERSVEQAPAAAKASEGARDASADVPDSVLETTDVALVDKWIKLIEQAAQDAREDDNMTAFASLTAKLVSLLEHRRKVTPVAKDDPNDNPDMVALGDQVWERLKKALDG